MNSSFPPPSATPALKEKYDVFLSFRGEDTRVGFTSHLHAALLGKQIETYIDNRLEKGDDIGTALLKAIERSKIALVIFSKNYASSTWCLKELVHILECKKRNEQIVIPIFYGVDPSHVRKQQGTYALDEDRPFKRSRDEVANWRAALEEAANISGFHDSSKSGTDADFVEEVVQDVLTKLGRQLSYDLEGLFGIERKIEQIESLLCLDSPGVCCVGIWGMGGIGKTTLADAVFRKLSSKFEVCCFLKDVREKSEKSDGLHELRNKLVREILKDKDVNIDTPSIPRHIQDRLRRTKALIVLDDVNARKQLEDLVGDHDRFCQGSRIVITARDKGLLEQKVDQAKIFNVERLGYDEALQLFHSHAFANKSPGADYIELSREVVDYIKGIPLALKAMGSSFRRCKSKEEWEAQWYKLKQFPDEEIDQVLRISYDGLGKNEKDIFLDIACFHKGSERNYVKELLDSRDFHGEAGINDLIDRSLISISKEGIDMQPVELIEMHDLVQEMGRAIAQEQRIEERSRLFNAEDVYQVLTDNKRDGHVQAISFDLSKIEDLHLELRHANFKKMHQLKCLHVTSYYVPLLVSLDIPNSLRYLDWKGYPLKSLPSKFSAQNILVLSMPYSEVGAQLWNEDQRPVKLKYINLSDCQHLTEVPTLSRSTKIKHIDLRGCKSLVEIPSYFQHLRNLIHLSLGECNNLKNLPEMPCNLEFLDLSHTAIEELPSSVWSHEKISYLDITYCKHLKSLPSNSCKLKLSSSFCLNGCKSLCEFWELPTNTRVLDLSVTLFSSSRNPVSLPTNIWKLKSLESLVLSWCSKFHYLPEISEDMKHLEFLNLSGTAVKELPLSIGNLVALRTINLSHCKNLEVVPDEVFSLTSLQVLNLGWTGIKSIPASIKQAPQLSHMCLLGCKSLESLPELPPSLKTVYICHGGIQEKHIKVLPTNKKYLETLDLSDCSNFQHFPEISEAMEHLEFLNLSRTAIKELPLSIGNLVALRKLDLSSTKIKSIPASIKQAAQLSHLCLINCKSLESLPELPPLLQCLEAGGCTSLKTVSSSSTAITQGWEEYVFSRGLHEKHIFCDCPKLDENARSNIMADAQLRIMAIASSQFKQEKIEKQYRLPQQGFFGKRTSVTISCWGYEIPKWISHQSEGSSIKIELPHDWFSTNFLGFALSLVVAYERYSPWIMKIGCEYNFKTSNGESHETSHPLCNPLMNGEIKDSHEVFVWWYNDIFEEVVERAPSPTAFYKRFTEVNVDFNVQAPYYYNKPFWVEKCGICLLYGKDGEMIRQRALCGQECPNSKFLLI